MKQFVVPMLESERGWGAKIDGHAGPFDTGEAAAQFRDAYNAKNNGAASVPDWYIAALDPVPFTGQTCDYRTMLDGGAV